MYIPDNKIEEIRAAVDIVDVVSDYVRLKKSGSRYKGLCPFHDEKTPSFSVDPRQKLFYCFGCQKGGDVFTFLQEVEGFSFTETARMLAEQTGVPLPESEIDREQASETESIYHALRFAARHFYHQLTQTEQGESALRYLREERGMTVRSIKHFGLGYAPDEWDRLLRVAEERSITPETLEKAGLVIERKSGDGYYDRYRGRVIFPIFSHVGKVLGFAGRILNGDSDQPKYINSPETKVYHKSRVLYGLHQAKQAIRKEEEVLLVEGYTDVISLHQAGIEHAVACSGTALTSDQIKLLDRYAKRILLLYDADEAGSRAALRGIDLVLREGLAVYIVQLPPDDDPDGYVREHGKEAFLKLVQERRQDFVSFRYRHARRTGVLDTPEGEAETMHAVVETIARIPDALMRETYLRRASEVLGVPDIRLYEVLESIRGKRSRGEGRSAPRKRQAADRAEDASASNDRRKQTRRFNQPLPPERILLRLMLEHGAPMVEFILSNMAVDEFTEGTVREMVSCFLEMYQEGEVEPERIVDGSRGERLQNLAASVLVDEYQPSENWQARKNIRVPRLNEDAQEAAASAMTLLKLERIHTEMERVKQKQFKVEEDSEAHREFQQRLIELQHLKRQVEKRTFLEWNE